LEAGGKLSSGIPALLTMLTPLVCRTRSRLTPFEIFRELERVSHTAFFLDSGEPSRPQRQRYSYLGAAPFLSIKLENRVLTAQENGRTRKISGDRTVAYLRNVFRRFRVDPKRAKPFFTGGAVGYWGYETAALFEKFRFRKKKRFGMPQIYLGFYRTVIVYDHKKRVFFLVSHYDPARKPGPRSKAAAVREILQMKSIIKRAEGGRRVPRPRGRKFRLEAFRAEISQPAFKRMVARAKEYIAAGDIYQANLSQRFHFRYRGEPLDLYARLRKINPSPFASYLKFQGLSIVSSSPERLVYKKGRYCETVPIAGTFPRKAAGRGDRALVREFKNNPKERAEHIMLVDLERNDLGRVCDWPSVRVPEMMRIEKYSHVMHLVSRVVGRLSAGKDAFDVLAAMFPGGTITGCPKIRCMEIIDELEPAAREIYTGSIGHFGFDGNMDLNIVIRTLVMKKNKGFFQAGAGIVYDSDPEREFQETLHKGEALAQALVQTSKREI